MMKRELPRKRWLSLIIVACLFFSPSFLQGCDTFGILDESNPASPEATEQSKFRHAHLLNSARTIEPGVAGKAGDATSANLVLGLQVYEADGVTPRILNKYDVTRRLLNRYGDNIEIKVTVEEAISAITVRINDIILEDFLADMEQDPDIAWVEPDVIFNFPDDGLLTLSEGSQQIIPWSVTRVGAANLKGGNHSDVHVFVLDTGVNSYDLEIGEVMDFTPLFEARFEGDRDDAGRDLSGHGTHVAGIIGAIDNDKGMKGIASKVTIHNLQVMTQDGLTDITTMLAAVNHVTLFKKNNPFTPVVVNLSLGADIETTAYNALDEAIEASIQRGVVYVIAAGNDGIDASTYSPAHVAEAITVGAYDADDAYSSFSNHGPTVDILAPGDFIVSLPYRNADRDSNTFILRSGTSHAAPHVAGMVARYLKLNPNATPERVHAELLAAARPDISNAPSNTTNRTVMIGNWSPRRR